MLVFEELLDVESVVLGYSGSYLEFDDCSFVVVEVAVIRS